MNAWTPDTDQIARIQKIVAIALPKYRSTIVGLNCDAAILRAVANGTTENLLLADGSSQSSEISRSDSINHISGDFEKIISLLTKVQFQADLFVLNSFTELPTALKLCGYCGEGVIFTDAKSLENLAIAPGDTAKHIWARINLDGTTSIKNGIIAVFFALSHEVGMKYAGYGIKTILDANFRLNRHGSEVRLLAAQNQETVKIWNKVKRIHDGALFEIQEEPSERKYAITLGPGVVKYFSIGNFLESSADGVVSSLKSISKEFTLKIPDCNFDLFSLKDLPFSGVFMGNFFDCKVDISDIDGFLAEQDWERRLRTHHAFCQFCFSNAMSSFVYACFHEWLDLKEFSFDECLKAWIKNGDQSETILDSYRTSTEHAVVRHESRNWLHWLVFAKTPFVKQRLEAKEAEAINKITASEIDRIRKSKFDCYVYVMEDLRNSSFKIGKSKTPGKRERTLQSEVPQVVMRFSIPADELHEKELHDYFASKRVRGEWFTLYPDDLLWVVSFLKKHGDAARASIDHEWLGKIVFNASNQ
jgi:hypothetical protein